MIKQIWTIGHSTRTVEEFLEMLMAFEIQRLVDVRHYPGSRKFPQFNKQALSDFLQGANIEYTHIEELGGRRKPKPDSKNVAWRHPAFRGYADYMESDSFHQGVMQLKAMALRGPTAFMCSEAVWWRCHRSLIADLLKSEGWVVYHILSVQKATEHPYTSAAKIADGRLAYTGIF
ncbi:MAG TPA: DUF488 domain-containing protein [Chryseosolibacter sp.]